MSIRNQDKSATDATSGMDLSPSNPLGEDRGFSTINADAPLQRTIVVSMKATMNDLCLQKNKAVWSPSTEALQSIFQQKKFTSLDGAMEATGDLKSIVLHKMVLNRVRSTFPMPLGVRITGVDDCTFASNGDAYSTIVMPNSSDNTQRVLQADDCSLAYEFNSKFPGYTAENLDEKGVHKVDARRFVLLAADHPMVACIQDNSEKLQMGEVSMMPEGLLKISSSLYDSIAPLVKSQVNSQIKVRDFQNTQVSIAPSDFSSWSAARNELIVSNKKPMKAQLAAELATWAGDADKETNIRANFQQKEQAHEHTIDHQPMELQMELEMHYNFLS